MRYYWIFFVVLIFIFCGLLYTEEVELEKKEDMGFLHFSAGAFKGIESNDLIDWTNEQAENIGAEERFNKYGFLPLVFADVSFYLNPHFSLGFGIGISNSTKNAVFRFSDENENEYEEYFEINATLSSFYGKPTIKFGSVKGFKPYFSTAVGLSVLNVYFDDFYFSGERIEHFLDGHLYFKQFYLRPSFGVSHKFFNIGDLAVEVGYVYTSGDNIYNVDEYEWKYNTRGIYINGVYERSF